MSYRQELLGLQKQPRLRMMKRRQCVGGAGPTVLPSSSWWNSVEGPRVLAFLLHAAAGNSSQLFTGTGSRCSSRKLPVHSQYHLQFTACWSCVMSFLIVTVGAPMS